MVVELREITRRYGSVVANDGASLRVEAGERVAIVGENGAGKSTLMKVLAGMVRPDAGDVWIDGRPARLRSVTDALALGIGMVHQHFLLVPTLTVAENIVLGSEPARGPLLRRTAIRDTVMALAEGVGLPVAPEQVVGELSVAGQQRVEILKALYRGARLLILDEPTAVLAPTEAEALRQQVQRLAEGGTAVVWISHKLPEVMAFAQRVVVMRRGRIVAERRGEETSAAELGRLVMGGPDADSVLNPPSSTPYEIETSPIRNPGGQPLLVLQGTSVRDAHGVVRLWDVHLEVQTGEIVGIAGVDGNGQAELVDTILGLAPLIAGRVLWREKDITAAGLAERRAMGVAHVPEDRQRDGLVMEFSLAENLALGRHRRPPIADGWRLRPGRMRQHAEPLLREFEVQPPAAELPARALSGGNQQKLILARELGREDVALVIAEQPTRGLDIRATEFVGNRLRAFRHLGGSVLLISTDLDELFALSDRIAVLFSGRLVAQALVSAITREQVGEWMVGMGIPAFRKPVELGVRMIGASRLLRMAPAATRSVAALLLAFAVAALLIAVTYGHPFQALGALLRGAFGDSRAWGGSLAKATPILFTGLAVAVAFRGGLFNIGVEGQLYAGALAGAMVGHHLALPAPLHALAALLAGAAAGAAWALPAAALKSRRGVHEVISTIMLNYVALLLTDWLAAGPLKAPDRMGAQTPMIAASARLPRLLPPTELTAGFLLAVAAALLLAWLLTRTPLGLEIRALGLNWIAAYRAGVPVERTLVLTFALSGALAGLAGAVEVLGIHHHFVARFSPGYGFDGIAVALLAMNNPAAILFTGIFFGGLTNGAVAMEVDAGVSRYLVTMIQAFAVVAVAVRAEWFGRRG